MFTYRDNRTPNERALEYELQEMREREERRQREAEQEREERRREFRARLEEAERSADTWPEALRKQTYLLRREVSGVEDEASLDHFFEHSARACEAALAHWQHVESGVAEQIATLEARIAQLRDGVRLRVADHLEAEGSAEWKQIAYALREETIERFLQW